MDNQDRTDLSLYSRLPENMHSGARLGQDTSKGDSPAGTDSHSYVQQYVQNAVLDELDAQKAYTTKVKNKIILLDNPSKTSTDSKKQQKRRRRTNKAKVLTAKEKRALDVYDIPLESRKYQLFLPLHELWKGYIEEIFGTCNPVAFTQKLLKADFHGANITGKDPFNASSLDTTKGLILNSTFISTFISTFLTSSWNSWCSVARSKCPTYVGASGIVAQETENVFKIITPSNALRVIPKINNVFTIHIRDSVFTLHGNQFRYKPSQRSAKKFKSKPTIDL
ncbi:RNase P/RNase MRP complex subunit [Haplosporangium sp. Z 767]|nr:RNase P/RNase MRP complex subunit [Haplosporangium sp. Z 767]KAF9193861.1 RNase P/RNase MRP complex subunit [Haplosporangium sp. Z 11]